MQVKIVKNYKGYKKGDTLDVERKKALMLIKSGVAIAHKMITSSKVTA